MTFVIYVECKNVRVWSRTLKFELKLRGKARFELLLAIIRCTMYLMYYSKPDMMWRPITKAARRIKSEKLYKILNRSAISKVKTSQNNPEELNCRDRIKICPNVERCVGVYIIHRKHLWTYIGTYCCSDVRDDGDEDRDGDRDVMGSLRRNCADEEALDISLI